MYIELIKQETNKTDNPFLITDKTRSQRAIDWFVTKWNVYIERQKTKAFLKKYIKLVFFSIWKLSQDITQMVHEATINEEPIPVKKIKSKGQLIEKYKEKFKELKKLLTKV